MNKKLIFSAFVLVAVFAVGGLAMAEDESSITRSPAPVKTPVKTRLQEVKSVIKTELKETRDAVKTEIKDTRNTVKTEIKDAREQMKEQIKVRTEAARADLEARKEEMKAKREEFNEQIKEKREQLKEQIKEKREVLKERLKTIKDERKKETVEKLDQRLDALNEKMTNYFSETLKKLDGLLVKIGERANKAEENGVDVSAVRSAVTASSTAIGTSRTSVSAQAAKTYTITITSEANLRQDVGKVSRQLTSDLKATRITVQAAHEAVRKAATTLTQLPKPTPTPSASPEVNEESGE